MENYAPDASVELSDSERERDLFKRVVSGYVTRRLVSQGWKIKAFTFYNRNLELIKNSPDSSSAIEYVLEKEGNEAVLRIVPWGHGEHNVELHVSSPELYKELGSLEKQLQNFNYSVTHIPPLRT